MTSNHYTPLPQTRLQIGASYELALTQPVKKVMLHSPAMEVMTDLRKVEALTTTEGASIEEAEKMMIDYGVRSLIVVDPEHKITGIITSTDILGDKPLQLITERGVKHTDILVRDIMTAASDIKVIDLQDVMKAHVGDVVETLKQSGRQHALVVYQSEDRHQRVCGIFSSTQIARQMEEQSLQTALA